MLHVGDVTQGYYYTLSFKLRVLHAADVTYVAYTHPYTATDLNDI